MLPLGLGLMRWRRLSPAARIIVWYFAFWSVEGFLDVWSRAVYNTNGWLFHLSVLVETWLLVWAYLQVLQAPRLRQVLRVALLIFTAVAVADATVLSGLREANPYARAVQVVIMLGCALCYFEQWLHELRARNPWRDFMFTVSVGLTIYYAGSVMGYLLMKTGPPTRQFYHYVMGLVINTSFIVAMVLMTLALWRDGRPQAEGSLRSKAA
jgi:hypothetical protein